MDSDRLMAPGKRLITVGLVLTITMFAFEALGVATVLPSAVDELGGLWLYGWAFSAFTLADILGITVGGRWADRDGPALPYLSGMALFGSGLVVAGLAPTMPVLVSGRAVQGLGAGAVSAVAYVSMTRTYGDRGRARILAVLSSSWVVPGLIGPGVSGFVAEHSTWRLAFLGVIPILALATALAAPGLIRLGPPAASEPHDAVNPIGPALRLTVGAALLLSGLGVRAVAVAIALVALGAAVAVPALRTLLPAGSLRARHGLPAAVATRGLLTFSFFGAQSFITLAVTTVGGRRPSVGGLVLTATTLTWTAGAWAQERRGQSWGWSRLVTAGFGLVGVGVAGLLVGLSSGAPLALVAGLAWSVAGLGMGIAYSSGTLITLSLAVPGREGATSSGLQLADVLGVALGAGVGGAAVALGTAAGSLRTGLALAFTSCLAAAIVGLWASRNLHPR